MLAIHRLSRLLLRCCRWLAALLILMYVTLWCVQFALVLNAIKKRFNTGYKVEFFNWVIKADLDRLKLAFSPFCITFVLPQLEITENGTVLETIESANFNYSLINNPFLGEMDITINQVGTESYLAANGKETLFYLHSRSPELRLRLDREGIITNLDLQYYSSKVIDKSGDPISMKSTSVKLHRNAFDKDLMSYSVTLQWREEPSQKWYNNCKNCNPMNDLGSTEIKLTGNIAINRGNVGINRIDNHFFNRKALLAGQYIGSLHINNASIVNDLFVIKFKDVQLIALNTSNEPQNEITNFEYFVERVEFLCHARVDIESYRHFLDFILNFIMTSGLINYRESVNISHSVKNALLKLQEQDENPKDDILSLYLLRPSLQEEIRVNGIPAAELLN